MKIALGSIIGFELEEIWWAICRGLYYVVDGIEKAFYMLAGIDQISQKTPAW